MDQFAALPLVMEFDDPSTVAAALRDASVEYLSHARGRYAARLTSVGFGPVRLQLMSDGPHLSRGTIAPDRTGMLFTMRPPAIRPLVNGFEMSEADVMVLGGTADLNGHVTSPVDWAGLTFDVEALEGAVGDEVLPAHGRFLPQRLSGRLVRALTARVRDLGAIAAADPQRLLRDTVQRGIADELMHLGRGVMRSETLDHSGLRALRRRVQLVRLADDYMTSRIGQPIYSEDMRSALGVAMRTLHDAFVAVQGMSMHRYLRLRRLNLARQALRADGDGGQTQVKAAALRYGFWHFGRFASEYRALFGELPSETARRH